MTTSSSPAVMRLLRVVAALQGVAIVLLATVLLGGAEPPPVQAMPAAAPSTPSPAPATHAAPRANDGEAPPDAATGAAAPPPSGDAQPVAEQSLRTVLYGRVVDEAGAIVPQASVWLSRPADGKQLATLNVGERQPSFAIAGLPAGDVAYRTRANGFKEQSGTIVIPAGGAQLRHDFVLTASWELAVKIVTPEGEPIHTALRAAAKERPTLFHVEVGAVATTARPERDFPPSGLRGPHQGLGRWRGGGFGPLPGKAADVTGVIELDDKQPLWVTAVLRHRLLTSVAVEPGQPEVTLTIGVDQVRRELGTIRGRIVDASGAPLTSAEVGFGDQQSGGIRSKVDADARFQIPCLRPGLLTMEVLAGERFSGAQLVMLEPGEVLDLGDVPLREPRVIKCRCEGLLGKADACQITAMPLEPPPHPAMRNDGRHASSVAADGTFSLYVTREGRYRVRASGAGGAVVDVDTRTLPDGPLVLQLAKESSLRLDVQTNGEPCELAVFDAGGGEVYRRDLQHGWKFALRFLPGDYRIELKDGRGQVTTRRVTLGADGAHLRVP